MCVMTILNSWEINKVWPESDNFAAIVKVALFCTNYAIQFSSLPIIFKAAFIFAPEQGVRTYGLHLIMLYREFKKYTLQITSSDIHVLK